MIGKKIHEFAKILWPINRSITGKGVRETLDLIKSHLSGMEVASIPSGTSVFDWKVPKEWSVNEAYIITPNGDKICDFNVNNLHLIGYSTSYEGELEYEELIDHLYTLPEQPNAIPYVTSYYKKRWGFCLKYEDYKNLKKGTYYIKIDTKLFDGVLNYGELILKGKSNKEIFISTYICHPSLANNELSGPTVVTYLAKWLTESKNLEYTYRIVFIPETIGSISYLSKNINHLQDNVFAGFNVSCIGDDRAFSYLPSRNGNTLSDEVAKHVLHHIDRNYKKYTWLDRGSDERQYCAPGVDLPIASIMRTKYGEYPEYHTSLDDLENVVTPEGLNGGYWAIRKALEAIEKNKKYRVTVLCEPQYGRRGLYPTLTTNKHDANVALMENIVSLCDGKKTLIDIAEILNNPIWELYETIDMLLSKSLIKQV